MTRADDAVHLQRALELAARAIGLSEPNPRVGCVLVGGNGRVLAEGFTQRAGGPHAEAMALSEAARQGLDVRGATAYVTLEPCAHHGRTPPCCDALISAGIARAVVALTDPFAQVAGRGLQHLREAGIEVELLRDGPLHEAARELNIGFLSRQVRGRPWVRVKAAASLDGRTALDNGQSQWITSAEARADGHAWRKRAGAVLTGLGTVLADDPRLDVRDVATEVQPMRVLLDSQLRLPLHSRWLATPGERLVMVATDDPVRSTALRAAGAEVLCLSTGPRVDLQAVLAELARRQVNELHVEAGPTLSTALAQAGLIDEWLLYLAPLLIGPGRGLIHPPALTRLADAPRWRYCDIQTVGPDLRLRLRPQDAQHPF
jgi:diaminohydroxyphosphoribosylaminopyrimidine deaminase / 5-amino-6-(5-phosphoribosylamino)uracil reductase